MLERYSKMRELIKKKKKKEGIKIQATVGPTLNKAKEVLGCQWKGIPSCAAGLEMSAQIGASPEALEDEIREYIRYLNVLRSGL